MKITQGKISGLTTVVTINIEEKDYKEKVDSTLKDYRKKAEIPGFRKGKTPMSIIEKKYKISVLVDQVNRILQDELYKYITEEKLKVLGSPLPSNETNIDWSNSSSFEFKYDLGIAPEINFSITKKDKLNYYQIKANEKLVSSYCDDISKRYGKMSNKDISEDGDLIFCLISQLDNQRNILDNGISNQATVSMDYIDSKSIKKKFIGIKKEESIDVDIFKAFKNRSDLSAMLNIKNEELDKIDLTNFRFKVININVLIPAALDKELFKKVYPKEDLKTEKSFKSMVKKEAEDQFIQESDRMLKNDVVTYLIDKLSLTLPDNFLKRWLMETSEQPITEEILHKEYDMYSKSLKWQLIENHILKSYNIQVESNDLLDHAKTLIRLQMKQYNQSEPEEKQLNDIANNILQNEDEKKKIHHQCLDKKTLEVYKKEFKLTKKDISYDDFVKLASQK